MKRLVVLLLFGIAMQSWAVPQLINYQGFLTRSDGTPLDTAMTITFSLYNSPIMGSVPHWTQAVSACSVRAGVFSALLSIPDAAYRDSLWLGIGIEVGEEIEQLLPRARLASVLSAYRVGTVTGASGGTINGDIVITGNLNADTIRTDSGIEFFDGTFQTTAAGAGQQYADTNSYDATRSWVLGRGYLTSAQAYADTNSWDATRSWVQAQGYAAAAQVYGDTNSWDATRTWVRSMGYLKGANNSVSSTGFVGGGNYNQALGNYPTVGGGGDNTASGDYATVAGGHTNAALGSRATVGGGYGNSASADYATVAGGNFNHAVNAYTTVGGGHCNYARGVYSVVAGGGGDALSDSNSATGPYCTIGGGKQNYTNLTGATVGGGLNNTATYSFSTVGGGMDNAASNQSATVSGGIYNTASGQLAVIGGGYTNTASGQAATVGGGDSNIAGGDWATVGGGYNNQATGGGSTVPGGSSCSATAQNSFAAGMRARAVHTGSFVWADSRASDYYSDGENSFNVRAFGGVKMYTSAGGGAALPSGATAWIAISDSTKKTDIRRVDTKAVLDKVAQLPISEWRYKAQADPSIRHMGPMAQDFWAAFHLGEDSLGISTIDPAGIALAAIQELAKRNEKLEIRNETLEEEIALLRTQVQGLMAHQQQTINVK